VYVFVFVWVFHAMVVFMETRGTNAKLLIANGMCSQRQFKGMPVSGFPEILEEVTQKKDPTKCPQT
jgi:hypothetical protein